MGNGQIREINGAGISPSEHHQITLKQANAVIQAAVKEATKIGQPMNLAVINFSGYLVTFERMDNGWPGSIEISIKKAKTCTWFYGFTTESLYFSSQPGNPLYAIEETNEGLIGAFGVSVGSLEQYVAVATAAVNAIN